MDTHKYVVLQVPVGRRRSVYWSGAVERWTDPFCAKYDVNIPTHVKHTVSTNMTEFRNWFNQKPLFGIQRKKAWGEAGNEVQPVVMEPDSPASNSTMVRVKSLKLTLCFTCSGVERWQNSLGHMTFSVCHNDFYRIKMYLCYSCGTMSTML